MAEPTNSEILRAVAETRTEVMRAIEGLRFDMNQHLATVNDRIAALNTRLGTLEDRVEMQGVTVRAIWDRLAGGGEHAA